MIGQIYFDWKGKRDSVKEYGKKLEEACKKTGNKFLGIYSPNQDKWNFCALIEIDTCNDLSKVFNEAGGMPETMPYGIFKYYVKNYP